MRVLVAEEDQVLAAVLLRSLRASGAVVDHVATGSDADATLIMDSGSTFDPLCP